MKVKLSLWLYSHRFGTDLIKVLVPDDVTLDFEDVVNIAQIDYEPQREDEVLEHSCDLPLIELKTYRDLALVFGLKPYVAIHPDVERFGQLSWKPQEES